MNLSDYIYIVALSADRSLETELVHVVGLEACHHKLRSYFFSQSTLSIYPGTRVLGCNNCIVSLVTIVNLANDVRPVKMSPLQLDTIVILLHRICKLAIIREIVLCVVDEHPHIVTHLDQIITGFICVFL